MWIFKRYFQGTFISQNVDFEENLSNDYPGYKKDQREFSKENLAYNFEYEYFSNGIGSIFNNIS